MIHGPPGTGKSQTIANVIATSLADGKRVLFVSEKTAALDVVKRRLESCQLGLFCLDLHSDRARKSSVYAQLREALESPKKGAAPFPLSRLEEQRKALNRVVRALHERRAPLGLTVFEVHGRYSRVRGLDRVDFPLNGIENLSAADLEAILDKTALVARRPKEFASHETSPWRALRTQPRSVELADNLRSLAATTREGVSRVQAAFKKESPDIYVRLCIL